MHDSGIGIGINSGMIPLLHGIAGILLEQELELESGFWNQNRNKKNPESCTTDLSTEICGQFHVL